MSQANSYKHTMHWPLTIRKANDGYEVSSPVVPGHKWTGRDEIEATRAATRGIHEIQGTRALDVRPAWMKSGEWVENAPVDDQGDPDWMRDPYFTGVKA